MREAVLAVKREKVVEGAARLFSERGYVATTLDDIAKELGVTKPLIYSLFESKSDLLAVSFHRVVDLCLAAISRALEADLSNAERLRVLVREIVHIAANNRIYSMIFLREERSLDPDALSRIRAKEDQWHAGLRRLLDAGVKSGEFDIGDVHLAALVIGGQIAWLYSGRDAVGDVDPEVVAEGISDLVLRMVGACGAFARL